MGVLAGEQLSETSAPVGPSCSGWTLSLRLAVGKKNPRKFMPASPHANLTGRSFIHGQQEVNLGRKAQEKKDARVNTSRRNFLGQEFSK